MSTPDLWQEAHGDSMEQADCWHLYQQMTPEQRVTAAACLQRWADGFHEFSPEGQGCIPDPREKEMEQLRKDLRAERSKIQCRECLGRGSITTAFGTRSSTSKCWKCNGEGRHLP